jgi:stage II sporulation protein D
MTSHTIIVFLFFALFSTTSLHSKVATDPVLAAKKTQPPRGKKTTTYQAKKVVIKKKLKKSTPPPPAKKTLTKQAQRAVLPSSTKKVTLSQPVQVKSLSNPAEITTTPKLMKGETEDPLKTLSTTLGKKKPLPTPTPNDEDIDPLDDDDDDDNEDDDDDDDQDNTPAVTPAPPSKKIMIRVLLKEFSTEQRVTFTLQSNRGFVLESPIASGKRARWQHELLNLLAYKHNLFLLTEGGIYKRIKANEFAIASIDGDLKVDNFRYAGTMHIRIDPKTKMVQMINKVNLDDYIYAVLRAESLAHWPLEMQKVQAVASRSYAVRQIKLTRGNTSTESFYDIKNNNSHQVYNGNHNSLHLRQAVDETHNLILTYNGNVALTMFDICCGGIIPGYMKKRDADKPYLFRKTRCTFCRDKANYEWKCAFDKDALLTRMLEIPKLAAKAKKLGKITGISLKEKDLAGIVHRVLIHGSRNNVIFTNNEFKSALGAKAKSNAYVVKKLQDDIVAHGYGFGHNMGLCQIGARELVSRNWDYQKILEFYFPKTRLMRLKVI